MTTELNEEPEINRSGMFVDFPGEGCVMQGNHRAERYR